MNLSPIGLYANVARLSETSPAAAAQPAKQATAPSARSFTATLAGAMKQATETVQAGETAAMQGLAGTMDSHQVVAAMTQAELTIQATVAIRDKMIQAYQEIMRMPV